MLHLVVRLTIFKTPNSSKKQFSFANREKQSDPSKTCSIFRAKNFVSDRGQSHDDDDTNNIGDDDTIDDDANDDDDDAPMTFAGSMDISTSGDKSRKRKIESRSTEKKILLFLSHSTSS